MTDKTREAFEAWAAANGYSTNRPGSWYFNLELERKWEGWQAATEAKDKEIKELREALRGLMTGCMHKTLYGVTGWHQKSMPTDVALDRARAALKEQQ